MKIEIPLYLKKSLWRWVHIQNSWGGDWTISITDSSILKLNSSWKITISSAGSCGKWDTSSCFWASTWYRGSFYSRWIFKLKFKLKITLSKLAMFPKMHPSTICQVNPRTTSLYIIDKFQLENFLEFSTWKFVLDFTRSWRKSVGVIPETSMPNMAAAFNTKWTLAVASSLLFSSWIQDEMSKLKYRGNLRELLLEIHDARIYQSNFLSHQFTEQINNSSWIFTEFQVENRRWN